MSGKRSALGGKSRTRHASRQRRLAMTKQVRKTGTKRYEAEKARLRKIIASEGRWQMFNWLWAILNMLGGGQPDYHAAQRDAASSSAGARKARGNPAARARRAPAQRPALENQHFPPPSRTPLPARPRAIAAPCRRLAGRNNDGQRLPIPSPLICRRIPPENRMISDRVARSGINPLAIPYP